MTAKVKTYASVFTMPLLLGVVSLVLLIALLSGQSSLLLLCALLLVLVAGAKAWSHHSLAQLRSALRVDRERLFPDDNLTLAVDVENTRFLPVWLQVAVPLGAARSSADTTLFAFQRATFEWKAKPGRRGVHRVGPVELEAADPLGFFPNVRLASSREILVYPRLVPLSPIALSRRDFFDKPSARSPVYDPTLIQGVRDYQHGRTARAIHWKVSARHNRIIEKVCEVVEHESVLMLLDVAGFEPAVFEACLEVIASLGAELDRQRYAFGLQTNGRQQDGARAALKLARREGQLAELLEALARIEAHPVEPSLAELALREPLPHGVSVVVFRYGLNAGSTRLWEALAQRKLAASLVVCDPDAAAADAASLPVHRLFDLRQSAEGARA